MYHNGGRNGDESLRAAWQELAAEAQPWLLKPLAQGGAALAARYALWKERLSRLRPGQRRALQRRLGVSLAGAALLLALAASPGLGAAAPGATITVDQTSGAIAVDGACSLPEAINNANGDSQYSATAGECAAGSGPDTIYLDTDVTLTASNNSTFGPTGLPVVTSAITIEGQGNTISRTSGTFRIMAVGSGGNLTLNSATISGGVAAGDNPADRGGGIYAVSSSLVVTYSTLSGNSAGGFGGGIFTGADSSLSIANSTLSGNSAAGFGGGTWVLSASATVINSTLTGNSANSGGGIAVGAITTIENSTISSNTASGYGGGVAALTVPLSILNSSINDNTASSGGGVFADLPRLTITNSTLSGNTVANRGGGISTRHIGTAIVANSTLSGNSAGSGGGISSYSAYLAITNSTLSGNSAASKGGGIVISDTTLMLQRSLVGGNTAPSANEIYRYIPIPYAVAASVASYNLFGHSGETEGQAFSDFTPGATDTVATSTDTSPATHTPTALAAILSATLADNDSPVVAGAPPGAVVQTLALPAGSPAIDKAPSVDCVAPIFDLDQRGQPRNFDGNGAASSNECDIGAFEFQPTVPRIVVRKQTLPNGDTTPFEFRLRGPVGRTFTLTDNQPHSTGQVPAGIYTLEEILPPGWDPAIPFASMTCDDGSPLAAVDLAADEVLVCRFLNYKRGNIVVKKVTLPPVAAPSFAMRLINNTTNAKTLFSLANAQQFDTGAISSVPTYKLLETLLGGWKRKNIVCSNGSPSTAIAVPPGGSVTCTVTNENTAPSNILLSNSSVAENKAIGTLVGNLSATDAVAGDTHTFSFVNDGTPAAANNGNFQIVGNQLKTAKKFDFEQKSSHNIKLMVTDSAGQTRVKAFVISILDGPN